VVRCHRTKDGVSDAEEASQHREIISKRREAEIELAKGGSIGESARTSNASRS